VSAGCGGCGRCSECTGIALSTPRRVRTPPGRASIETRISPYRDARASMIAGLSLPPSGAPPTSPKAFASLRTRDSDDPSIALIDAAAMVVDTLDFYSARLASEPLLDIATEGLSVDLLGGLVGYRATQGVAAETQLAFEVEPIARDGLIPPAVIPAGTRVSSMPGPGETSVTFETDEQITARPEWNRMRLVDIAPGSIAATAPGGPFTIPVTKVMVGDTVLLTGVDSVGATVWGTADVVSVTTEKSVVTLGWAVIRWAGGAAAAKLTTIELLGAPLVDLANVLAAPNSTTIDPNLPPGAQVNLATQIGYLTVPVESSHSREGVGSRLLVGLSDGTLEVTTVTERQERIWISAESKTTLAIALLVTEISTVFNHINGKNPSIISARPIGETLAPANQAAADLPASEHPVLKVWGRFADLPLPRSLIMEQARTTNAAPKTVAVVADKITGTGTVRLDDGTEETFTTLELADEFTEDFIVAGSTVWGNVASASHGESRLSALGSGVGAVPGQSFEVKETPIVQRRTSTGVDTTLAVRVNGVRWSERDSFFDAGPRDQVYVVSTRLDGSTRVVFGDGERGARPADGVNNITATLRVGGTNPLAPFTSGNVGAGRLSSLVDRPLSVTKVRNPAAALGGVDPAAVSERRERIPIGLRAFRRAVSPEDYADLALEQPGVSKARVDVIRHNNRRRIILTIAGSGSTPGTIGPFADVHDLALLLQADGSSRTTVTVVQYSDAAFTVSGTVAVNPAYELPAVLQAVRVRLRQAFNARHRRLGASVATSDLVAVTLGVPGITSVDFDAPVIDSVPTAGSQNSWPGRAARIATDGTVTGATLVSLAADAPDRTSGGTVGLRAIVARDASPEESS